jgi:hypothetical protein
MNIEMGESWCIGNNSSDVEAGQRAGCKTVMLDSPSRQREAGSSMLPAGVTPDYRAVNIKEAVNIIKKHLRSSAGDGAEAQTIDTNQAEPTAPTDGQASEAVVPAPQIREREPEPEFKERPPEQMSPPAAADELLGGILAQLKSMQRAEMFDEFSVMRLLAGVVQVLVLFCLLITVWFLMSPTRQDNPVFMALGFAIAFQLMALTFYTMHGRK